MTTEQPTLPFDPGLDPRSSGFEPLDLCALFGNTRPVLLEIGSGKGRWLMESARSRPEENFLGIEKSLHYFRVIRDRIAKHAIGNARIINHDAFPVISRMIPDRSIREIHIYFPDPWPRPREQKRRIIRSEVLEQFVRILSDGGSGIYVTDHRDYFEAALPVLAQVFQIEQTDPLAVPPRTNYEAKYRLEGRPIYEVQFRV